MGFCCDESCISGTNAGQAKLQEKHGFFRGEEVGSQEQQRFALSLWRGQDAAEIYPVRRLT